MDAIKAEARQKTLAADELLHGRFIPQKTQDDAATVHRVGEDKEDDMTTHISFWLTEK